jgi:hypothetical protein
MDLLLVFFLDTLHLLFSLEPPAHKFVLLSLEFFLPTHSLLHALYLKLVLFLPPFV